MRSDFSESARRAGAALEGLARISSGPGITRLYLTPEHRRANGYVGHLMEQAGLEARVDAVGNIRGRRGGTDPEAAPILVGSHLDTVVNAGAFDGCLGVIAAIEAARVLKEEGVRLRHPLEVLGFGDEEGARFGVTYLGSRGVASGWTPDLFERKDASGVTVREALRTFGLDPSKTADARIKRACAYFEFHIEQGLKLRGRGMPFGLFTGIASAKRFTVRMEGRPGHAGTTPMDKRADALCAASEFVLAAERLARDCGGGAVATAGSVRLLPNVANCIPQCAELTLDVRAATDEALEELAGQIFAEASARCAKRGVRLDRECYYRSKGLACSPRLMEILRGCAAGFEAEPLEALSLAGHDAAAIGERFPVAMAFVRDAGFSHCPAEKVDPEDIGATVELVARTIIAADRELP